MSFRTSAAVLLAILCLVLLQRATGEFPCTKIASMYICVHTVGNVILSLHTGQLILFAKCCVIKFIFSMQSRERIRAPIGIVHETEIYVQILAAFTTQSLIQFIDAPF